MHIRAIALASAIGLALGLPAHAQTMLRFSGSTAPAVRLDTAQAVDLLTAGQIRAACVLRAGTTACEGMSDVGGQTVPTVALAVQGLTADAQGRFQVATGQDFTVTTVTNGVADVCAATATPAAGATGWTTLVAPAASGAATVRFANAGEAVLGLRCYNAGGAAPTATQLRFIVNATAGGGCSLPPSPHIRPQGLEGFVRTWNEVFERPFPNAPGYLIPLGSFTINRTMNGPLSASHYLAISFTAQANLAVSLSLAPSQPIAAVGYTQYRPGAAFMTISPCAGDFRPPAPESPDLLLRNCRAVFNGENVFAFGHAPAPNASWCQLTPGQTYYLNVVFAPPGQTNGFVDSCEFTETRCEINAQPRGIPL